MFDHSIKVPRLYKTAAKLLNDVENGKGSLKELVYEIKHQNIKALYALVAETLKKRYEIDKLAKRSKIFVKESRLDSNLARILITELLWGKKRLAGESKPVKTILAYEQIFKAHLPDVFSTQPTAEKDSTVQHPRYVRINTLLVSNNEAVDALRDEGWNLIRFTDKNNYRQFLDVASSLGPDDFMVDLHVPDLLLFHPKTQFYNHEAYKKHKILLQDKASCIPVHILNPPPGSTVLDMCAAPGMKTTQLAASINNEGTIYAVELNQKRFETLNKIVEDSGATCIKTINRDVLTITASECPGVEYILVDPSCSGSGMVNRLELKNTERKNEKERLEKLAGFQIKILRHALTRFPSAKRVVYSTCSLNVEENEDVVRQVLETCTTFKLVSAKKSLNNIWSNVGSSSFGDIGKYCIYSRPDVDLANGFFVAAFERLEDGEENKFLNKSVFSQMRVKSMAKHHTNKENSVDLHEDGTRSKSKNKKGKYNNKNKDDHMETNISIGDHNEKQSEFEKSDNSKQDLLNQRKSNMYLQNCVDELDFSGINVLNETSIDDLHLSDNNIHNPEQVLHKKKKKKIKLPKDEHKMTIVCERQDEVSEINCVSVEEDAANEENIQSTEVKKRKNKNQLKNCNQEDGVQCQKRKKKHKHSSIIEYTNEIVSTTKEEEVNDLSEDITQIKADGKKRKNKRQPTENCNQDNIQYQKTKKKHKHSSNAEDAKEILSNSIDEIDDPSEKYIRVEKNLNDKTEKTKKRKISTQHNEDKKQKIDTELHQDNHSDNNHKQKKKEKYERTYDENIDSKKRKKQIKHKQSFEGKKHKEDTL